MSHFHIIEETLVHSTGPKSNQRGHPPESEKCSSLRKLQKTKKMRKKILENKIIVIFGKSHCAKKETWPSIFAKQIVLAKNQKGGKKQMNSIEEVSEKTLKNPCTATFRTNNPR